MFLFICFTSRGKQLGRKGFNSLANNCAREKGYYVPSTFIRHTTIVIIINIFSHNNYLCFMQLFYIRNFQILIIYEFLINKTVIFVTSFFCTLYNYYHALKFFNSLVLYVSFDIFPLGIYIQRWVLHLCYQSMILAPEQVKKFYMSEKYI